MEDKGVKKLRGDFGEEKVCDYLLERGFEIISRNYRKRIGEIDIIALSASNKASTISFIEVKTRKFNSLVDGAQAITPLKQRKIVKTAKLFLAENPKYYGLNINFDAAEVVITDEASPKLISIEYYEKAYDPLTF